MTELGLSNADLVKASTEQLTFKMVQKARKGKPLTPNVQNKIVAALKVLLPDKSLEQIRNGTGFITWRKLPDMDTPRES